MQRFYTTTVRWEETPWSFTVTSVPASALELPGRFWSAPGEHADALFTQALAALGLERSIQRLAIQEDDLQRSLSNALAALHVSDDGTRDRDPRREVTALQRVPRDLLMAVDYVLTEPIHVFEQSPPYIDSILAAARTRNTLVGGVSVGLAITFGASPLLLLAIPAGVVIFGVGQIAASMLADADRTGRITGLGRSLAELEQLRLAGLLSDGEAEAIKGRLVRRLIRDVDPPEETYSES